MKRTACAFLLPAALLMASLQALAAINITQPNDTLYNGQSYTIIWTGGTEKVALAYTSPPHDFNWIATNLPGSGQYNWTVPSDGKAGEWTLTAYDNYPIGMDTDSDSVRVNVEPTVLITYPGAADLSLGTKSTHEITWTYIGETASATGGNFTVRLNDEEDLGTPRTVSTSNPYTFTLKWRPTESSEGNYIKVKHTNTKPVRFPSDAKQTFKLETPVINVQLPSLKFHSFYIWDRGSSHTVQWDNSVGHVQNVKVQYGKKGEDAWFDVSEVKPNTGTYSWLIPNTLAVGKDYKICVADLNGDSVGEGPVDGTFWIVDDRVTVTGVECPLGTALGQNGDLRNGQVMKLDWVSPAAVEYVKIQYYGYKGSNPPVIGTVVSSVYNTGAYQWTVPNSLSRDMDRYVFRVSDANDSSKFGDSFNLKVLPTLEITDPANAANLNLIQGDPTEIKWKTYGTVQTVTIQYSTDNGQTWTTLATAAPNSGKYPWTPTFLSDTYQIKIFDPSQQDITAISSFKVVSPSITVTKPEDGSTQWAANSRQTITWTSNGVNIKNVKIELLDNLGNLVPPAIADTTPNDGSFEWTIPDTIAGEYKICISDANAAATPGVSPLFKILDPAIVVTAPTDDTIWHNGTEESIEWTAPGIEKVSIFYSTDGGATFTPLVSSIANSGTHFFTVPDTWRRGDTYVIKVSDASSDLTFDDSETFEVRPKITVSSPAKDTRWAKNISHDIVWTTNGVDDVQNVNIWLVTEESGQKQEIAASHPNDAASTRYSWLPTADTTIDVGKTYYIRVEDAADSEVEGKSGTFLAVSPIAVLTPNWANTGSDGAWFMGTKQSITWIADTSIQKVKIEYSIDNGATWTPCTTSSDVSNSGAYEWQIPSNLTPSTSYLIRVSDANNLNISGVSDPFEIAPGIDVLSPNVGNKGPSNGWAIGTTKRITWTTSGLDKLKNVKISYKSTASESWTNIATVSNIGYYDWAIPASGVAAGDYQIRVASEDYPSTTDDSDVFEIQKPAIVITSPVGGETWANSTQRRVTWQSNMDSNGTVRIDLMKAGAYHSSIVSETKNIGTYTWNIPDYVAVSPASDYTVRIRSNQVSSAEAQSFMAFAIQNADNYDTRGVTLTQPQPATPGSIEWKVGTTNTIRWNSTVAGTVNLQLFKYYYDIVDLRSALDTNCYFVLYGDRTSEFKSKDLVGVNNSNGNDGLYTIKDGGVSLVELEIQNVSTVFPYAFYVKSTDGNWNFSPGQRIVVRGSPGNDGVYTVRNQGNPTFAGVTVIPDDNVYAIEVNEKPASSNKGGHVIETLIKVESPVYNSTVSGTMSKIVATIANDVDNYPPSSTYNWFISSDIPAGTEYGVRVSSNTKQAWTGASKNKFTILPNQYLIVTAPNGGELYPADAKMPITWDSNIGGTVTISLSLDGGQDNYSTVIATNVPNNNYYEWTVNNVSSTQCRVKVTSDVLNTSDTSDGNFSIIPRYLTLATPAGGENWPRGSIQRITWNSNLGGDVQLFYNPNYDPANPDTGDWKEIDPNVAKPNNGSYHWDIPLDLPKGEAYGIKITSKSDPAFVSYGAGKFAISDSTYIQVVSPNGNERWAVGTIRAITWRSNAKYDQLINIDVYRNGNFVYRLPEVIQNGPRSAPWVINGVVVGQGYTVKLSLADNASIQDSSDAPFELQDRLLSIIRPNGGESLVIGQKTTIEWISTIGGLYDIDLYQGTAYYQSIAKDVEGLGYNNSYVWTPRETILPASGYKVKITSKSAGNMSAISGEPFTIVPSDYIIVTSPNGGEVWPTDFNTTIPEPNPENLPDYRVKWVSNYGGNVKIEYTSDGGLTWSHAKDANGVEASSVPNNGVFAWKTPNLESHRCQVKVTSVSNIAVSGVSDRLFTLSKPFIKIKFPVDSSTLVGALTYDIRWESKFVPGKVRLELWKPGAGVKEDTIVDSAPNNDSYKWRVPRDLAPGKYVIKVIAIDDEGNPKVIAIDGEGNPIGVEGVSMAFDIVAPKIEFTAPSSSSSWIAGTTNDIKWTSNIGGNIKISLLKGGSPFEDIITSYTNNASNTFPWSIRTSQPVGEDYQIRISSLELVEQVSNDSLLFKIGWAFKITSPEEGQKVSVDETVRIQWEGPDRDTIPFVRLDLYKAGAPDTQHPVISASTENDGEFEWTVAGDQAWSEGYQIKLRNLDGTREAYSGYFEVKPSLVLDVPNLQGISWIAGTANQIHWKSNVGGRMRVELLKGDYTVKSATIDPGAFVLAGDQTSAFKAGDLIAVFDPPSNDGTYVLSAVSYSPADDATMLRTKESVPAAVSGGTLSPIVLSERIPVKSVKRGYGGQFAINGVHNAILAAGSKFVVRGSTGNDGAYTVSSVALDAAGGTVITVVGSDEIKSDVADGEVAFSIAPAAPDRLRYDWKIPLDTAPAADYRVKLTALKEDPANPSQLDPVSSVVSEFPFEVVAATMQVTSPNGGETLYRGNPGVVTWSSNLGGYVKIEMSADGGATFPTVIVPTTANTGSFPWIVPSSAVGVNFKIRISSVEHPSVASVSAAPFTIADQPPYITVLAPGKDQTVVCGTTVLVTWLSNIAGEVKIELFNGDSPDNQHPVLAERVLNNGSFRWTVDTNQLVGRKYKVRITSLSIQGVSSESEFFTVAEVPNFIDVFSPDGGENWGRGSSKKIQWYSNVGGNVRIDLYKGDSWFQVISYSSPNVGEYLWAIPQSLPPANDYKILVSTIGGTEINDKSSSNFTITDSFIAMTRPNGGEQLAVGSKQEITWRSIAPGNVQIDLLKLSSSGQYVLYSNLALSVANSGSYDWVIPRGHLTGNDFKIRITSVSDTRIVGESDESFSLLEPYIMVSAPAAGDILTRGRECNLRWFTNLGGSVTISLLQGGVKRATISALAANTGSFSWKIPASQAIGVNYQVRVASYEDREIFGDSAMFGIGPSLTISKPEGGESFWSGAECPIAWTMDDAATEPVALELWSKGAKVADIATVPNSGSHPWVPSAPDGAGYYVKAYRANAPQVSASSGTFSLTAPVISAVASPGVGARWPRGSIQNVAWVSNGFPGNVAIALVGAGGSTPIASVPNKENGSYAWSIPDTFPVGDYTITVTGEAFPAATASSAPFSIYDGPYAGVSTPDAAAVWLSQPSGPSGSEYRATIQWKSGKLSNIELALCKGANKVKVAGIASSLAPSGVMSWAVPYGLAAGDDYSVQIQGLDSGGAPVTGSSAPFRVAVGTIAVTSPTAGQQVGAGNSLPIAWTHSDAGANVRLELLSGGAVAASIADSAPNTGSYTWTVPAGQALGNAYQVRVTSLDTAALFADSGVFSIIQPPSIGCSATQLIARTSQGEDAPSQTFQVWNAGASILNFTVSDNVDWMDCQPTGGTSAGAADKVTVTVSFPSKALAEGTHFGAITIQSDAASNSPLRIPVTIEVGRPVPPKENLRAWFVGDTVPYTSNFKVPVWPDLSGQGNDATQGKAASQPSWSPAGVGGKPAVLFTGSSSLALPSSEGINLGGPFAAKTIAMVIQPGAMNASKRQVIFAQGSKDQGLNVYLHQRSLYVCAWNLRSGAAWGPVHLSTPVLPDVSYCLLYSFDSTTGISASLYYLQDDGALAAIPLAGVPSPVASLASDAAPASLGAALASTRFHDNKTSGAIPYNGMIAELCYYNSLLTRGDTYALAAHLARKYSVAAPPIPAAGLGAWFKADGRLALVEGDLVKAWYEAGGSNDLLKQASASRMPRLAVSISKDSVQFDGVDDLLASAKLASMAGSFNEIAEFVVFTTPAALTARQVIWAQGDSKSGCNVYIEGGALYAGAWNARAWGQAFLATSAGVLQPNTTYMLSMTTASGVLLVNLNGAAIGRLPPAGPVALKQASCGAVAGSTLLANGQSIRAGSPFAGSIEEIVAYKRALSQEEFEVVEAYLAAKYAINIQ